MVVKYSTEELRTKSDALTAGAGNLQDLITQLQGQVNDLMIGWEGAAGGQFQQTYQQFTSSATTLQESLGSIAKTLASAANVYDETEEALKGSFIV